MGSKNGDSPKFRSSVGGYNKTDVMDYVARKEAESEMRERRQNELEKKYEDLKSEISRYKASAEADSVKNQEAFEELDGIKSKLKAAEEEKEGLKQELEELKRKLRAAEEENTRIKQELEELTVSAADRSLADPKTIQAAILNAQRMSDIIIEEANQKADDIRKEAAAERLEQEEAGRQAVEAAEQEALRVTDEAEKKCINLQQDYDRILLDVTKFKSELMDMYRRHMELLAALPEKKDEPECIESCIDIEFYEDEED